MQAGGRLAGGRQVAVAGNLAVAPADGGLQLADGSVEDHFLDARIIRLGVHLGAYLGGEFAFFRQPVGANHASFLDADGEGLFAVNVEIAVERPVGDEGVMVVGRANHRGIEPLVFEAVAPVGVGFGAGKCGEGILEEGFVDIAQGDDTLLLEPAVMGEGTARDADEGDVELAVRPVGGLQDAAWQYGKTRRRHGRGVEEPAAIHDEGGVCWGRRAGPPAPRCQSGLPKTSTSM
jgi:hypothetical protein